MTQEWWLSVCINVWLKHTAHQLGVINQSTFTSFTLASLITPIHSVTMSTSAASDPIEDMAKEQIKYQIIFREQAQVLKTNQTKFDEAMAKIQQSSLVAKQGQHWEPTPDKVDEYLSKCDEICHTVPHNFDDHVKILHAAYAALMCIVTCKNTKQPESVQLAVLRRRHKLLTESVSSTHPTPSHSTTGNCEAPLEAPLSKPLVEPRHITNEELQLFQNPENLHGKQFILSPDTNDSGLYEVIGYSRKQDRSVAYEVLFDDCEDPIVVDTKGMMGMLEDSLYFPA
ncbi:hypothetical protein EDB89DRAFT_129962 [Lactarius sanguifluus]|nr:hypothetical protein EDB89DRAFT_129962 [Lactarius sanguifluus]